MACTTITIVLELDKSVDCPSGCARLQDGTAREFHGWLGLAAALDSLARTPGSAVPAAGDPLAPLQGGSENVR